MNKLALLVAAAAAGLALQNCAKNPTEKAAAPSEDPAVAQAKADSESWAMLLPAYQLNQDAASRQRLTALKANSGEPEVHVNTKLPAFGTPPIGASTGLNSRPRPLVAGALLKSGAQGSGNGSGQGSGKGQGQPSLAGLDTSFYLLGDSALGYIHKVHAYTALEAGASVNAVDTLDYYWPYDSANAMVMGHKGARAYANGSTLRFAITDEDGDHYLNAAVPPKPIQLRKVWVTVHGDTTWKSIYHTVHGHTTFYDSIGPGATASWTDSVMVAGKTVFTQHVFDGDGDGMINTAAAGAKVKIKRDSYTIGADGIETIDYEIFGPGADGKYETEADNERYPYQSLKANATGNLAVTKYGDADGDGFYWNPASAGTAKAWISNEYPAGDSLVGFRDSLVQELSGTGGAVKKITYFSSTKEYKDGRMLLVFSRMPGGSGSFTGTDTVPVWEKLSLTGYTAKGTTDPLAGLDSTLRVTWMIPGVLETPADDKVVKSYSQAWYKAGQASVTASELFTPTVALAAGEAPKSGTLERESRSNPTSSKSVIRTRLFREFNAASTESGWTRTDYFENGDSATSSGAGTLSGAGSYVQDLGRGARNTGFYDAKSGEFQDTLALLDFKGGEKSREVAWGTYDADKGTGDYYHKRLSGKDTATSHIVVTADGNSGFTLKRVSASDTAEMHFAGDTATLVKTRTGVKRTYTWTTGGGASAVTQHDENVVTGASVGNGSYVFGLDLSGNGTLTKTPAGKSPVESKVQFQADGTAYVDGVKVGP